MNTACKHCSSWGTRWIQLVRRAAIVSTLCSTTDVVSIGWCCEAPSFQPGWPSLAARVSRQFLLAHVQQCYGKLRRLETDLFFQKHQLEFVIGQQWLAIIEEHKGQAQEKVARTAKERQKKFDMLVSKQSSQRKPDKWHVVNLSSNQLTTPQLQVLSKGLNFAPTPKFR